MNWKDSALLLFLISVVSINQAQAQIQCYVGTQGFDPQPEPCPAGTCATYSQNGVLSYGCFTAAYCGQQTDPTCCTTNLCNDPSDQSTGSPTVAPLISNYPDVRTLLPFSSTWNYFVGTSNPGNWTGLNYNDSAWISAKAPIGMLSNVTAAPYVFTTITNNPSVVAIYFRYVLNVNDEVITNGLIYIANIMANDGYYLYVNGNPTCTNNLANPLYTQQAVSMITSNYDLINSCIFATSIFVSGENVIAIEVHRTDNSTDFGIMMDVEIQAVVPTTTPFAVNTALITKGSTWSYSTNGFDSTGTINLYQKNEWYTSNLVTLPSTGTAPFGSSSDPTVITPLNNTKQPVFFFTSFSRSSNLPIAQLTLNIRSANGYIVYLGGVTVVSYNVPNSALTSYSTTTKSSVPAQTYLSNRYVSYSIANFTQYGSSIPLGVVVFPGVNQTGPIIFDLELIGYSATETCTSFDVKFLEGMGPYPYDYNYTYVLCVFPFIFGGVARSSCITSAGRETPWCGVTSNVDIDGAWGYCDPCTTSCTDLCWDGNNGLYYPSCTVSDGSWAYCNPTTSNPTPSPTLPTLTIPPGTTSSNSTGLDGAAIGGIVGAIVGVSLLLGIGLGVYLYQDHKVQKEKNIIMREPKLASEQSIPMNIQRASSSFLEPGSTVITGHTTVVNTYIGGEVALPAYLELDYAKDIREEKVMVKGGQGSIFYGIFVNPELKAKYKTQNNSIIIKKVNVGSPQLSEKSGVDPLANFHQEVAVLSSLSFHPNIIQILGFTNNPPTIIFPLYDADLRDLIYSPTFTYDSLNLMDMVQHLASGLDAIHSSQIAHRDLKPQNILLEKRDPSQMNRNITGKWSTLPYNLRIGDFGVSYVSSNKGIEGSRFANIFGLSYPYTPPEIFSRLAMGSGNLSLEDYQMADIYSFSICLWELLHRQVPWQDVGNNEMIKEQVIKGARLPINIAAGNDHKLLFLINVVHECWDQVPTNRPGARKIVRQISTLMDN